MSPERRPGRRGPLGHTDWCTGGHHCGLGEHRAAPLIVDLPGVGRAVITRVRDTTGRDGAEVRIRLALASAEPTARRQLAALLTGLGHLLTHTTHQTTTDRQPRTDARRPRPDTRQASSPTAGPGLTPVTPPPAADHRPRPDTGRASSPTTDRRPWSGTHR